MTSFIEVYENALDNHTCDKFMKLFEEHRELHRPGVCGDGMTHPEVKTSTDITLKHIGTDCPFTEPLKIFSDSLHRCIIDYCEKYSFFGSHCPVYFDCVNIQRYLPGEGFYEWHIENAYPHDNRALVFMCYLNDVENGGTEFGHGLGKLEAKKGSIILWPPFWTHPHRGIISHSQTKYIITNWMHYYENNT